MSRRRFPTEHWCGDVHWLNLRLAAKYESDLALVRDAAQRDPRLVASVIKTWMANDEG